MYKLVIAEKHSVAQSLAKVIGATEKKDGYSKEKCYRSRSRPERRRWGS